jgi:hypothetical protein
VTSAVRSSPICAAAACDPASRARSCRSSPRTWRCSSKKVEIQARRTGAYEALVQIGMQIQAAEADVDQA